MGEWGLPLILAASISLGVMWLLLSNLFEFALDVPNHRSLHSAPVPRTGGWALVAGMAGALAISPLAVQPMVSVAFLLLIAVSALDDLRDLSARLRFAVHMGSVSLLLLALPDTLPWWSYPILLIGGVWVINLYNFMDGMDGFAGSMTVFGFATLGLVSFWRGYGELAGICGLLVVSTLVFLRYNWPPARIFLGDVGSTVLGLAAVAISLFGWRQGAFSLLLPLVVFAPFWLDATLTLMKRMLAGKRWWEAHREHWYQRRALLVGVRCALLTELAIMVLASAMALLLALIGVA
ncbi:putative undecaprenyl-phosphate N-acetylglucosaminyl 1-phosphate transferase [Microbulbifer aggregans]|uniref:Putative undecaprenyl-phosphate N-acetylglucosaminyl 1-phosphate transferase n=1 Tax=Microbulbifer aggregans TaxID=1769779 RepID=A0A1C9WB27_9GAMM|nr:putative undecaprenyl-phosphate N-acetylglucosaminyl 1-phosphate transferase [Microbulbifer aggregans]